MKKRIIWIMILLIFSVSLTIPVWAQEKPIPVKRPPKVDLFTDKTFVEVFWLWEVVKILDLNEKKLVQLLPKFKDLNILRTKTFREKRTLLLRLKRAISNGDDQKIEEILGKLENLEKNYISEKEVIEKEIRSELTLEEWAKFVLLQEEFEKKIKVILETLRNAKVQNPQIPSKKR